MVDHEGGVRGKGAMPNATSLITYELHCFNGKHGISRHCKMELEMQHH